MIRDKSVRSVNTRTTKPDLNAVKSNPSNLQFKELPDWLWRIVLRVGG
ncbi:MAG: hypothetical protein QXY01_02280 [Candidatus Bathyarchaeia archaeon]